MERRVAARVCCSRSRRNLFAIREEAVRYR